MIKYFKLDFQVYMYILSKPLKTTLSGWVEVEIFVNE
jgi:hypothetical protein